LPAKLKQQGVDLDVKIRAVGDHLSDRWLREWGLGRGEIVHGLIMRMAELSRQFGHLKAR
jgi:hypothetical protein